MPGTFTNHLTGIRKYLFLALVLLFGVALVAYYGGQGHADRLGMRTLSLSSSAVGATTDYTVSFMTSTTASVGSIYLLFCANTPVVGDPCTAPVGFDLTAASATVQGAMSNMTVSSKTANSMVLSRPTQQVAALNTAIVSITNVKNPSNIGSYYLRVQTLVGSDNTGPDVDEGGFAFALNDSIQLTTKVPPFLEFCSAVQITTTDCTTSTGYYINFGNAAPKRTSEASSQFVVATNGDGYQVQVQGASLTSGNNVIPALTVPDVSRPGTSQFGLNLRANVDPAIGSDPTGPGTGIPTAAYDNPDKYVFASGDTIASSVRSEDYRKYTVSYILNVSAEQPVGTYASTLNYICSGNF